mmetsp:Transcript_29368/g.75746  ORF Transcript_29368/g.75746 Transcript_29368/m.75746 type:complete len:253 (+) Transcript_29368:1227-1985(+)
MKRLTSAMFSQKVTSLGVVRLHSVRFALSIKSLFCGSTEGGRREMSSQRLVAICSGFKRRGAIGFLNISSSCVVSDLSTTRPCTNSSTDKMVTLPRVLVAAFSRFDMVPCRVRLDEDDRESTGTLALPVCSTFERRISDLRAAASLRSICCSSSTVSRSTPSTKSSPLMTTAVLPSSALVRAGCAWSDLYKSDSPFSLSHAAWWPFAPRTSACPPKHPTGSTKRLFCCAILASLSAPGPPSIITRTGVVSAR